MVKKYKLFKALPLNYLISILKKRNEEKSNKLIITIEKQLTMKNTKKNRKQEELSCFQIRYYT